MAIYYTTDGTTPTAKSSVYEKPVPVEIGNYGFEVKYVSIDDKGNAGPVFSSFVNRYFSVTAAENKSYFGLPDTAAAEDFEISYNGYEWEAYKNTIALNIGDVVFIRKVRNLGFFVENNGSSFITEGSLILGGNISSLSNWETRMIYKTDMEGTFGCLFAKSKSIVDASNLILNVIGPYCYANMFSECSSLLNAPSLVPNELSTGCYLHMFKDCTSLTTAPTLPAKILVDECYDSMFQGCKSLNAITIGTMIWDNKCSANWVQGVPDKGTFTKPSRTAVPEGTNGIPNGWTVVNV